MNQKSMPYNTLASHVTYDRFILIKKNNNASGFLSYCLFMKYTRIKVLFALHIL